MPLRPIEPTPRLAGGVRPRHAGIGGAIAAAALCFVATALATHFAAAPAWQWLDPSVLRVQFDSADA